MKSHYAPEHVLKICLGGRPARRDAKFLARHFKTFSLIAPEKIAKRFTSQKKFAATRTPRNFRSTFAWLHELDHDGGDVIFAVEPEINRFFCRCFGSTDPRRRRKTQQGKQMSDTTADLVRLSKRMSELGLCSPTEADEWIAKGWVKVDGEVVSELGSKVRPDQKIKIDRGQGSAERTRDHYSQQASWLCLRTSRGRSRTGTRFDYAEKPLDR